MIFNSKKGTRSKLVSIIEKLVAMHNIPHIRSRCGYYPDMFEALPGNDTRLKD